MFGENSLDLGRISLTGELPISPASTVEHGLYLVVLACDVSLKPCLVTVSQGTVEDNLGVVPGTETVSLWSSGVYLSRA